MTRRREQEILMASAGAALALVLACVGWVAWRHTGPEAVIDRSPGMATIAPDRDVPAILAWAPFGGAAGGATTLTGLTLKATFMAQSSAASSAVIAVGDAPAQAYFPGQAVGGAVLESVAMDHVALRVGGRIETLAFPRFEPGAAAPTPAARAATSSTVAAPARPAGSPDAAPASQPVSPVATDVDGPSVVDAFRQRQATGAPPPAAPSRPLPPPQSPAAQGVARPGE